MKKKKKDRSQKKRQISKKKLFGRFEPKAARTTSREHDGASWLDLKKGGKKKHVFFLGEKKGEKKKKKNEGRKSKEKSAAEKGKSVHRKEENERFIILFPFSSLTMPRWVAPTMPRWVDVFYHKCPFRSFPPTNGGY